MKLIRKGKEQGVAWYFVYLLLLGKLFVICYHLALWAKTWHLWRTAVSDVAAATNMHERADVIYLSDSNFLFWQWLVAACWPATINTRNILFYYSRTDSEQSWLIARGCWLPRSRLNRRLRLWVWIRKLQQVPWMPVPPSLQWGAAAPELFRIWK